MEVFISWTGADREVKNVIVDRLTQEGLECWDSDKECTSDYSEECIAAVKKCQVFIVIISDESMKKGYVFNEVVTAKELEDEGKLNVLVYKVTDAPYTDRFAFQLNHISFVSGNLINRKETVRGESSIDMIVKRTKRLLERRREGNPEKPFDVKIPEIDGLKITKPGYFVENSRDGVMTEIEESFEKSNVIVLKEICGFGKKSAVKKYADLHRNEYDRVVISENGNNSLRHFFSNVLSFTNINPAVFENLDGEAIIKKKIEFLEKLDEKHLLVVSGVNFESRHDEFICQIISGLRCRIIFITEGSTEQYDDWFPVISIGKMEDEYLYELFFHYYNCVDEDERSVIEPHLKEFFSKIGGHTKTVELTGAVLSRDMYIYPEDVPKYLGMQDEEGTELKDRIVNQISYLFNIDKLSEDEITALLVASYIAVPGVSEKSYRDVLKECGVTDWQVVTDLEKRRWLDLDMKNRKVSVEPLISTIILNKFTNNYFVAGICLLYIMEILKKTSVFKEAYSKMLKKSENIFMNTNLPLHGCVAKYLFEAVCDEENFDTTLLEKAISDYENRTSSLEELFEECFEECFGDSEEYEDDVEDEISDELDEEDYLSDGYDDEDEFSDGDNPYDPGSEEFNKYEYYKLADLFMEVILPTAKISANKISSLVFDFSAQSDKILSEKMFNLGEGIDFAGLLTDLNKAELKEMVEFLREQREKDDDFDEDDAVNALMAELASIMESLYNRDFSSYVRGINEALKLIEEYAEDFFEFEDLPEMIYQIFSVTAYGYINSNLDYGAVRICRKILGFQSESASRILLLKPYIIALKNVNEYGEDLFASYREYIYLCSKDVREIFENRTDQDTYLKEVMLDYVCALIMGDREKEALKQFDAAQKKGLLLAPDKTVETAEQIVDMFVAFGEFEEAVNFLKANFSSSYMEKLENILDVFSNSILEKFRLYMDFENYEESDFQSGGEEKYISYYHNFSRKNNSLTEQKYTKVAEKALAFDFSSLSDDEIRIHSAELKKRAKKEKLLSLAPEAFALASEAGKRVLGYKHHYVQYMGAAAMADGKIAEILNGEGKTYTIVLTAFLNYLYGRKVFVIDSSVFLTKRNFSWMRGVYRMLGMTCDILENWEQIRDDDSPQSDVIYTWMNEKESPLIFSFLNSEVYLNFRREAVKYDCAIIDETDSVLVDNACRSYELTRFKGITDTVKLYNIAYVLAQEVEEDFHYSYKNRIVRLNSEIHSLIEKRFSVNYSDVKDTDTVTLIERLLIQAIRACNHFELGKDYHLNKGIPVYEDRENGKFGRFAEDFEFFLLKKHNLKTENLERNISVKKAVINSVSVKDMFRKFGLLCGTTATAVSFKKEFEEIYGLEYVAIPPFAPCIRTDHPAPMYMDIHSKDKAVIELVKEKNGKGQPVLLATQSIQESEKYAYLLKLNGVKCNVLNAYNEDDSTDMIAFAGKKGSVLVATALVNRGVDIKLGGNPEILTKRELVNMGVDISGLDNILYSLSKNEREDSELYRKYSSVLEKNKAICSEEKKEVVEAGGLCVIATSFFAEPRVEQQTRGRSGRQGEKGESYVFHSLDDDYISDIFRNNEFVDRMREFCDGSVISSKMLNKQCEKYQQKIHSNTFAKIRSVNKRSKYIDDGREYFIERHFAVAEDRTAIEKMVTDWTKTPAVKERLNSLQKNKITVSVRGIDMIYLRHKEDFSSIIGARHPERVLARIIIAEFNRIFEKNPLKAGTSIDYLRERYIAGWEKYIDFVKGVTEKLGITDREMNKIIDEEREKLLSEIVESFVYMLFYGKSK